MPLYLYQNEKTGEIREILQSMNELHEYNGEKGNEKSWKRIFTIPQASIDTKQDPFSTNDFLDRTKSKKGTYGNMLDYSKELSEKRSSVMGGVDPIKQNYYKEYSKNRRGAKHPDTLKKSIETKNFKIDF
jgi:predicted nucleic acid-binding Zn ribbon protein